MQTKPEHLWYDLLKHLGVTYSLSVHQDREGTIKREHHLYVDGPIIQDVLQWSIRHPGTETVRIFEGDPPPF